MDNTIHMPCTVSHFPSAVRRSAIMSVRVGPSTWIPAPNSIRKAPRGVPRTQLRIKLQQPNNPIRHLYLYLRNLFHYSHLLSLTSDNKWFSGEYAIFITAVERRILSTLVSGSSA